ncbi:MAG: ParB N-terminal domain-containing protein [Cyanophyceae cyanobacterium]
MATFLKVDVESITSNVPRSQFSEANLERLAERLLETEGLLKPLVLKKTAFESYEVIYGHLEYYAAVRASEKNPRQAEMVNVLVVPEGREAAAIQQIETLQQLSATARNSALATDTAAATGSLQSLESRLMNLELRVEKGLNQVREEQTQERARTDNRLREIESLIPQRLKPLEALNTLSEAELAVELERSKVRGAEKLAQGIISARKKRAFANYQDVVKSVRGLGPTTVLNLIDDWLLR